MDGAAVKSQNFDSRTLALLNRLANRRQSGSSTPPARPESAKADLSGGLTAGAKTSVAAGRAAAATGVRVGTPIDFSGKSQGGAQRPASAARIQHFQLQNKGGNILGTGGVGERPSTGMNVQGKLFNLQMGGPRFGVDERREVPPPLGKGNGGLNMQGGLMSGFKMTGADGDSVGRDVVGGGAVTQGLSLATQGPDARDRSRRSSVEDSVEGEPAGGGGGQGVVVINRSKDEKFANPERLNLDRRKLTACPILEGEERLRLLNYQNNLITKIQHLDNLPNLIFLDLYNNQLRVIENLHVVTTLRVLMLGKNLMDKIQGLGNLTRLDVLDLHSNHISKVENLSHLAELRVLNLAGNNISVLDNLQGLVSLTELNLRRNQISGMRSLETLPCLQRVFVSNNNLATLDSLASIFNTKNLLELALDGNPVAAENGYRQVVLDHLKSLRHLDLKRVTEEERRLASAQARKVEERMQVEMRKEQALEEKQESIRLARLDFDQDRKTRAEGGGSAQLGEDDRGAGGGFVGRGFADRTGTAGLDQHLHIYGRAPEGLERSVQGVVSAHLQYVTMARAAPAILPFLQVPTLVKLTLSHNDLRSLPEMNPIGALTSLLHLEITDQPLCASVLLRPYALFLNRRLAEFNGEAVTETERLAAQERFANLSKLWGKHLGQSSRSSSSGGVSLPPAAVPLAMAHHALDALLPAGLPASTRGLPPAPGSGRGERERQAAATPSAATSRANAKAARQYVVEIAEDACAMSASLDTLHHVWPAVLRALVESTLEELEEDASLFHVMQDQR